MIPDDKKISEIYVKVLSGDETGYFKFTDGTQIEFDASNSRNFSYFDGEYTVVGEHIMEWLCFDTDNVRGTLSYARQHKFEDLEDYIEIVEDKAVDFKVRLVRCSDTLRPLFTVGKVYDVKDGLIYADDGYCFDTWGVALFGREKTFEYLDRWFKPDYDFELVEDEKVEDEKMFTKNDLKTGDVVKYRNGDIGIVFVELGSILFKDDSFERLDLFKEDLTVIPDVREYDIVAVRRPTVSHECRFSAFEHDLGELVYEREEVKVEEMTLEEVCEALGKKIKIVESKVALGA
jgi:hypothetical protein